MELEEDIKRTIEYAEKFGCRPNAREIKERLISNKIYRDKEIEEAIKTHRLCETPPLKREALAEEKVKAAEKFVSLIKNKFKDILFIGVTGSVAAGYPDKDDDIDLMIVTKKNKLWLTRLKMRWFIYKNNIPHRKYGQRENNNELCFNFWLDEDNLRLPNNRQNLRCSVDLILMKPLWNREKIYERFILENDWAKKWVATGYSKKVRLIKLKRKEKSQFSLDYFLNLLLFVPQYLFMKRRIKNEEVGLGYALFWLEI